MSSAEQAVRAGLAAAGLDLVDEEVAVLAAHHPLLRAKLARLEELARTDPSPATLGPTGRPGTTRGASPS